MSIGDDPQSSSSSGSQENRPEPPPQQDAAAAKEPTASAANEEAAVDQGAGPAETGSQPAANKPPPKIGRTSGPLAARGLGVAKPASPTVSTAPGGKSAAKDSPKKKSDKNRPPKKPRHQTADQQEGEAAAAPKPAAKAKVPVPNRRLGLPDDIQAEVEAQLASADVDLILGGAAGMPDRQEPLADGARVHGQVLKIHDDNVFVALGGPDEGFVPFEHFKQEPTPGDAVEVVVRGVSSEDGLYILSLPGGSVEVSDWEDLEEGSVVEATVTGHNSGGLECKVGGVRGFIPISQVSEYRVEDLSEFVDQKFLCVVTEANAGRGNLVLSRRAVLEREREEKKQEQLAKIEPGHELEGTVRSIKDFGAFVDLGALDGLIHISKLSWDRVKHPSEVLEVGQKVKVKIDKIDKETGKISLSYRDLLDNPWDTAETDFAIGSVHRGTVTRIATFGCFVKLAAGVEGLVHISELAHHRVSRVDTVVAEGQEVEVKVMTFDRETQKIGLSIKAAQSAPADAESKPAEEEVIDPQRDPVVKASHSGPLKGGNNRESGGERFGLRW